MRFRLILLVLFGINIGIYAQEMAGLAHSNHAGTDVLFFNPAGMHHQKDWLSIHVITGDFFFSNNYAYIKKQDFKSLRKGNGLPMHETGYSQSQRPFYIYDKGGNTRMDMHIKLQGPAFMYIYNEHAFSIFSAARAVFLMKDMTPDMGNLLYYGFDYDPQHNKKYNIDHFKGSMLAWGEVGFAYAYQYNQRLFSNWNFGVSIRKLYGGGGSYLYVDNADYNLLDSKTLELTSLQADMGFSMPVDYNNEDLLLDPLIKGKGWGFDIGFEYQALIKRQGKFMDEKVCGQKYNNYKYRWGISLMDIGSIKFTSNAQLHHYGDTQYTWERIDTTHYESWNGLIREVSTRLYGEPTATLKATSFTMWLPMSLNASFDYNFENKFYLNTALVLNAPLFNGNYVPRPSILSVTPRYETRNFEAALPLSIYQWQYPRVGLALRFYYFTIGSDYLTSLLGFHDFNGTDIYFSLKMNIEKGSCKKRRRIGPCGTPERNFPWSK